MSASGVCVPVSGRKNTTSASCSRWWPSVQVEYLRQLIDGKTPLFQVAAGVEKGHHLILCKLYIHTSGTPMAPVLVWSFLVVVVVLLFVVECWCCILFQLAQMLVLTFATCMHWCSSVSITGANTPLNAWWLIIKKLSLCTWPSGIPVRSQIS